MKYLFLSASVFPYPTGDGLSVMNDGLLEGLARLGWDPIIVPVALRCGPKEEGKLARYHTGCGREVLSLPGIARLERGFARRARRVVYKRDDEMFPTSSSSLEVLDDLVRRHEMRAIVAAGWQALALGSAVRDVYRVASLVDLIDPSIHERRQAVRGTTRVRRAIAQWNLRRMERLGMRLARRFDLVVEHAHQHAETLRAEGFPNVVYVPHPLVDPGPVEHAATGETATILLAGSFKGATSIMGFEFLLDEILPALERRKGEMRRAYRIRVVGHGEMPALIRQRLAACPQVDLVGFVDRIDEEYRRCDALLVAIPVEHGFRTRIAEALSYGACVVAHAANRAGMPELRNGEDVLCDTTGDGIAAHLVRVVNDPAHARRIAEAGRATFVREYSRERAVERLRAALPARLLG